MELLAYAELQAYTILQLLSSVVSVFLTPLVFLADRVFRLRSNSKAKDLPDAVFITGASRGIGAGIAFKLASQPQTAALYLAARSEEGLLEVARKCKEIAGENKHRKAPLRVMPVVADVTDRAKMDAQINSADTGEREMHSGFGLTCVVANAGVASSNTVSGFDAAYQIADVNVVGVVNTVVPTLKLFEKRKSGQIVIVSSISSYAPTCTHFTSYGASKSFERFYGETLRVGMENSGVDVLVVAPGFINTDMTKDVNVTKMSTEDCSERVVSAMRRRGTGTIVFPFMDGLFSQVFNGLPVQHRSCISRMVLKSLGVRYSDIPN